MGMYHVHHLTLVLTAISQRFINCRGLTIQCGVLYDDVRVQSNLIAIEFEVENTYTSGQFIYLTP